MVLWAIVQKSKWPSSGSIDKILTLINNETKILLLLFPSSDKRKSSKKAIFVTFTRVDADN